ncbi:MAG: bifunctional tetrahydrofolate synthase/dihydrofolate synthase [Gammaproteobacteria bacterium]|nr:bifunctional tetrahydrofolate synthase/dihydrofolate synthase [Gammaproteobacteria bacterium]
MRFNSLADWLSWQETQHPVLIDLGLERVSAVLRRMGLAQPPHAVVTVAGTNGKGSCVALLESIYRAAGYRTGSYSSPHLLRYNERIRMLGAEVDDARLCAAFERVDAARAGISLSYFEFGTLAALRILQDAQLDVAILEVGLGGRLDAVNIVDPDVAVVTSIGIDHVEWLGPDRESIGREKAGIFRAGRPAICGDPAPPHSLQVRADELATPLYRIQHDFGYEVSGDDWTWWGRFAGANTRYEQLPFPALRGAFQLQNAATAVMAMQVLMARLPVSVEALQRGLTTVSLPGRFQVQAGPVTRIFDVAHNPHGAAVLARTLQEYPCAGRTLAVFSMLADKDIAGVVGALRGSVHHWQVAALPTPRAATAAQIMQAVRENAPAASVAGSASVGEAWRATWSQARPGDRVLVFGSFYTVAEAMQAAL